MAQTDRRRRSIRWELIITLLVTLLGYAFGAGAIMSHQTDTDKRLDRIEQKFDNLEIYLRKK